MLLIHTYPGANATFARHLPFYKRAGIEPIVAVGTNDGKCSAPAGIARIDIGINRYIGGDHLPRKLIDSFHYGITYGASRIVVIEYDVIFLRELPETQDGLTAQLAGGRHSKFKCERFWHSPWIADINTAKKIVEHGRVMIGRGEIEFGHPDCFIGLLCEQAGIPCHPLQPAFSRNSLDLPGDLELAAQAARDGAIAIHGVKLEKELEVIEAALLSRVSME